MGIEKYFLNSNYVFGDIISMVVKDLDMEYNFTNVLFIRTYTTGHWLDNLLTDKPNVDRILYYTNNVKNRTLAHNSTIITHSDNFEQAVRSLNKTYDLICFDTYHEYDVSSRDFVIISSLLNESGILISHDCFPWNKTVATPHFIQGNWCGETYISFVNFAYNNPEMFYAILNTDTGIGIASKKDLDKFPYLSNKLNKNKQEYLLSLHENNKNNENNKNDENNFINYYDYFRENSKEIINAISL